MKAKQSVSNTPKLPESIKNYLIIPFMESCNCSQHSIDGVVEIFEKAIAQELSTLKAQVRKEIEGLIEKYQKSEEVTVNGQRFLIVGGLKKKFGYPFPDTKEKYLIREIKQALSILKEE